METTGAVYSGISVATDLVIFAANFNSRENKRKSKRLSVELLITQRHENPMMNKWTLPGGFVTPDKGILETIQNKVLEKTGVGELYMEQLYTYGDDINRDPRGRVISVTYISLLGKQAIHPDTAGNNLTQWVTLSVDENGIVTIPVELAFDHMQIVQDAYTRIRNKIMWTDVAFEMLDYRFTLRELQDIHEYFTGKAITNFQRFMGNRIKAVGETRGDSTRPAQLYEKA